MFNPKKLIELRRKIEEEATKYHITNIALAATDPELMDYPFQFIGDYENSSKPLPSPEEIKSFLSFLKTTLSHVGISFSIRSRLADLVSYDEGYQYIFDTAIPLGELDENKSFKEQFQERKERADKERLTNAASKQDNKRKVNSEGEEAHKICWEEKVRGHKRVRADIDENKLTNILQIFYKDCDELNNDELKSLQQRLNDFFASKSKNIGEERCIS